MNKSEMINELAAAFCKAQAAMGAAAKDASNAFLKSKYADMASVVEAVKGPLTANGLAYAQLVGNGQDGNVSVETVLMHSSGQWISEKLQMKPEKCNPQGMGSVITYARRYGLQSICGIPAEDDDGNAASEAGRGKAATPAPPPSPAPPPPPPPPVAKAEQSVATPNAVEAAFIKASEEAAARYEKALSDVQTIADLGTIAASIKEDAGILTQGDGDALRRIYTGRLAALKKATKK